MFKDIYNFHTYRNHVYSIHSLLEDNLADSLLEDNLADNPTDLDLELATESQSNEVDPDDRSLQLGDDQCSTELFVEETNAQSITSMLHFMNSYYHLSSTCTSACI